jgi:ABC-type Fe3+/spermidine/putrescine transport system ATPase subunit
MSAHLTIDRVTKTYGDLVTLNAVDLAIGKGEFFTLLGPSGCGKTTLLRIIAGFVQQDSGVVSIAGRPIDGIPPHRRNIGMVFQNYAVFPHMSVFDNVAYGLRSRGMDRKSVAAKVNQALARVQLEPYARRFPQQLSGGQKQRVGLARAMVIEPDVLLMDEPLSNLDAKLRVEMRQEIRLMQRELGITTIYVTHDQEEALAVSDRILVLERGEIRQVGVPRAIYDDPAHRFVAEFIGGCNWLAGTVEQGVARFGDAIRIPLKQPAGAGETVVLALRPEHLHVGEMAGLQPLFHAKVALVSYLGAKVRLRLSHPEAGVFEADLIRVSDPPQEGETVAVSFDPARAWIFAASDGRRLS